MRVHYQYVMSNIISDRYDRWVVFIHIWLSSETVLRIYIDTVNDRNTVHYGLPSDTDDLYRGPNKTWTLSYIIL